MNTISINYTIKYELDFAKHYKWLNDNSCFNAKTGRKIKQTLCGGSIGYVINGKFRSLYFLRKHLQRPKVEDNLPF
jgi:hypothetical protein